MLADIISQFFTAVPKEISKTIKDHNDPQIRKRERQGIHKQNSILSKDNLKKLNRGTKWLSEDPIFDLTFTTIAMKYIKSFFIIDILACLPLLTCDLVNII